MDAPRGDRPLPAGPVLLTGGSGFVGAAVARALLAEGHALRALVRGRSCPANLRGLPLERVRGDLTDPASLRRALRGCGALFHVAARYTLWEAEPRELYRANVGGTAALMRAALDAGVERVVYTSTVGAIGLPADGSPGDETTPLPRRQLVGHYKRSKALAERVVRALVASEGLPAVIVNPSAPMGPRDIKPTPTGQLVVDFLNDRMPAFVDTGLNVVDVDDVARGHLLAARRGAPGRRYILGGENLSLGALLGELGAICQLPAPTRRIPHGVALAAASVCELLALASRRPPAIPLAGVRMAAKRMFFDASRARRELGFEARPARAALRRAVAWFAGAGYVGDEARARRLAQL